MVKLDYDSSSIGIDFGGIAPGVKKILLVPDKDHQAHWVTQGTFDIFYSNDNSIYTVIPRDQWEFAKDASGVITVTLKQKLATRYLKIHVLFDHRDPLFKPKDRATFLNTFAKILQIYQESDSQTEEYAYDGDGNRKFSRITLIQATANESLYYPNSDRLKTDGKYLYSYDNAGNLISKERTNLQEGETAEKRQYQYDLLNRLIRVTKNGTIVAEYEYDPEGLRVVKKAKDQTIHYVFEGTEPIFEENITTGKTKSYIYALGKHLARVDGVIGDPDAKVYWYTTDHLGSVKAVTDKVGKVVYNADYFTFGKQYGKNSEVDFEELHGFTGKEYDEDTGLSYFNARWYDSETGRFISDDPIADPNNPNLYSYCANNPLTHIDPTGLDNNDMTNEQWIEYCKSRGGGDSSGTTDGGTTPPPSDPGNPGSNSNSNNNNDNNKNPQGTNPGPDLLGNQNPGGNGVSFTVYNPDGSIVQVTFSNGKIQSEVKFGSNGSIKSSTVYNPDGTRAVADYKYTKDGILVTGRNQHKTFAGWRTENLSITGYNSPDDLKNGNWAFNIANNGKLTIGDDRWKNADGLIMVNGDLILRGMDTFIHTINENPLMFTPGVNAAFYVDLIFGPWNFMNKGNDSLWGKYQFHLTNSNRRTSYYNLNQFGNIVAGYVGQKLGIPYSVIREGGYAYHHLHNPGKGDLDEDIDQKFVQIGYNWKLR